MREKIFEIKKNQYQIQLVDDVSDTEIFYSLKDNEDPPLRYRILILKEKNVIAEYVRNFDVEPPIGYLNNFFKKVLRDVDYRVQYLDKGEWNEIIELEDPVNPKTRALINRLNSKPMKKLRFKDFANLKVGGRDSFSKMKEEDLDVLIDKEDKKIIESQLNGEKLILTAKRWVARGLHAKKAIRKVKTDEEIRINYEKSLSL